MKYLDGVVFLAAHTARSKAYTQVMKQFSFCPEKTIIFGKEKGTQADQTNEIFQNVMIKDMFLPNLDESLTLTATNARWDYEEIEVDDINDKQIFSRLKDLSSSAKLVIYSGYGSQIVSRVLLDLGLPFLHMHAGWVPQYRGSTTLYYSWIVENNCAVSAIFLDPEIDKGPIIKRKRYPPPPEGVDPDYIYDCAIRADMLKLVLQSYYDEGQVLDIITQTGKENTYYVIHPVLKHIARLRK